MKCIKCGMEMEMCDERDDNPYVDSESYVCDCGCSCDMTYFGAGSDEPSNVSWTDEDGIEI